ANGVLSRFDHAKRDRENSWIEQHHGLTRDQLYELPTKQRKTIQKEARAKIRAENSALTAELKIIDEHRKRVTHKGKPGVEPGPQPDENAPPQAHQLWQERVELAGLQDSDPEAYREQRKKILAEIRPLVNAAKRRLIERGAYQPRAMDISTLWREIRNLPKDEGGSPWWEEVSIYAFTSGFAHAETAWKNHLDSLKGIRKGPLVGRPRFKTKRRARKSFTLYGSIQLDTYRRLRVPNQGSIRLHNSGKRLHRAVTKRGGIIKSVTISQGGHRWYASVLVDEPDITPGRETQQGPSPAQRAAGGVGVDIGVLHLAALSTGMVVENPRHVRRAHARLVKAQRALSRTVRGSQRRRRAAARVARIHHQLAERRATHLHGITKL